MARGSSPDTDEHGGAVRIGGLACLTRGGSRGPDRIGTSVPFGATDSPKWPVYTRVLSVSVVIFITISTPLQTFRAVRRFHRGCYDQAPRAHALIDCADCPRAW